MKVRETRLTGLFSNILIGLSIFLLPYPLAYIPTAVLDGLFLYMAVTALNGNQMFERITLLFMEQVNFIKLSDMMCVKVHHSEMGGSKFHSQVYTLSNITFEFRIRESYCGVVSYYTLVSRTHSSQCGVVEEKPNVHAHINKDRFCKKKHQGSNFNSKNISLSYIESEGILRISNHCLKYFNPL